MGGKKKKGIHNTYHALGHGRDGLGLKEVLSSTRARRKRKTKLTYTHTSTAVREEKGSSALVTPFVMGMMELNTQGEPTIMGVTAMKGLIYLSVMTMKVNNTTLP